MVDLPHAQTTVVFLIVLHLGKDSGGAWTFQLQVGMLTRAIRRAVGATAGYRQFTSLPIIDLSVSWAISCCRRCNHCNHQFRRTPSLQAQHKAATAAAIHAACRDVGFFYVSGHGEHSSGSCVWVQLPCPFPRGYSGGGWVDCLCNSRADAMHDHILNTPTMQLHGVLLVRLAAGASHWPDRQVISESGATQSSTLTAWAWPGPFTQVCDAALCCGALSHTLAAGVPEALCTQVLQLSQQWFALPVRRPGRMT
jgi:hypothetical protein